MGMKWVYLLMFLVTLPLVSATDVTVTVDVATGTTTTTIPIERYVFNIGLASFIPCFLITVFVYRIGEMSIKEFIAWIIVIIIVVNAVGVSFW